MDTREDKSRASEAMFPSKLEPELLVVDQATSLSVAGKGLAKQPTSPTREAFLRLRRNKRAMASVGIIVFFILLALIGPTIYQHIGGPYVNDINGLTYGPQDYHNFTHIELGRENETPSSQYWLGTDELGRDILARLMQGILVSLAVALLVEVVDVGVGVLVGVLAGFYGGWIDQFLARCADLMFAFPGLLLAILVSGVLGTWADSTVSHVPFIGAYGNARLLLVSFALAFTAWPAMARLVRGQTLQLKEQQFIEAARTSGTKNARIILRHIIPNLFNLVVVVATLNMSTTIVGEAGLSLLGLGVQETSGGSSIGLMIADGSSNIN